MCVCCHVAHLAASVAAAVCVSVCLPGVHGCGGAAGLTAVHRSHGLPAGSGADCAAGPLHSRPALLHQVRGEWCASRPPVSLLQGCNGCDAPLIGSHVGPDACDVYDAVGQGSWVCGCVTLGHGLCSALLRCVFMHGHSVASSLLCLLLSS